MHNRSGKLIIGTLSHPFVAGGRIQKNISAESISTVDLQSAFIRRRFRVPAERAGLIAALHFGGPTR